MALIETITGKLNKEFIIDDETIEVSCSIGVAIYPDDGITTDSLLATADSAMYKVKHKRPDAGKLKTKLVKESLSERPEKVRLHY